MAFSNNQCHHCTHSPTKKVIPCGHTACDNHAVDMGVESGAETCGHCSRPILEIQDIGEAQRPSPSIGSAHSSNPALSAIGSEVRRGSIGSTHSSNPALSAIGSEVRRGSLVSSASRSLSATRTTAAALFTSARSSSRGSSNNVGTPGGGSNNFGTPGSRVPSIPEEMPYTPTPSGRYLPPQLRASGSDGSEIRPGSSISNVNLKDLFSNLPAPTPQRSNAQAGIGVTYSSHYAWARPAAASNSGSEDPFITPSIHDVPRTVPSKYVIPTTNGGLRAHAKDSSSPASSAHDSAAGAPSLTGDLRSVHLANLIRQGAAEPPDPRGRHRLPFNEASQFVDLPEMPLARGRIAAGHNVNAVNREWDPRAHNIMGNAAAFVGPTPVPVPAWCAHLAAGYTPTVEDVLRALPFVEACRAAAPSTAGVIKLTNVPYLIERREVVAMLGKQANIVSMPPGTRYLGIHVNYNRLDGKTDDVFVEVKTPKEAKILVSVLKKRARDGRAAKLETRIVDVEEATQGELMAAVFPRGKNVEWNGAVPKIDPNRPCYVEGIPSTGFTGFLLEEELNHQVRHAEMPQRSPFAQRCLVRVYENLITLLHKYPWYDVENVFLHERDAIYGTTIKSIKALVSTLKRPDYDFDKCKKPPTDATLHELVLAALTCPGFSEQQKFTIADFLVKNDHEDKLNTHGMNVEFGGIERFAPGWPFVALVKKPGVNPDFLIFVTELLKRASPGLAASTSSKADMHSLRLIGEPSFFGNMEAALDYSKAKTMGDAARIEIKAIADLLSRVLPRAPVPAAAPLPLH